MSALAAMPKSEHLALKGIIRSTGVLIVLWFGLGLLFPLLALVHWLFGGKLHPSPASGFYLILLVSALLAAFFCYVGVTMARRINIPTAANFSFIFAALAAYDFYHLLPPNLFGFFANHMANHGPFLREGIGLLLAHRGMWTIILFFVLYHVIKSALCRLLDLDKPDS